MYETEWIYILPPTLEVIEVRDKETPPKLSFFEVVNHAGADAKTGGESPGETPYKHN